MSSLLDRRNRLAAIRAVLLLPIIALLAGCSQDMHDLRSYLQEVKQRPGRPIAALPEMKPLATFNYPDTATRDPFAPLAFGKPEQTASRAQSGPRPDPTRPREALEEYPLDSLAFVGTLRRGNQLWALIRDPGGTVHRVQNGNYMGQRYGRVVAISPRSIELTELIPDQQGGWLRHEGSLAMND
ncbi:pilus assembly protein PilP [Nitrococcus mobilis]|uniref:Pilus assembly protein, PilQ n=1 Tax=Nitrococcus mobilis Nb-231 TaxID=314278 RepID=A4BQU7_9GAMM|nr:pilus assembly protein PilP [Nitrococcus mobilis]EAR21947.1 Pilus assembly protein, PilQ [Nitrococcus mobilis Nb-231]